MNENDLYLPVLTEDEDKSSSLANRLRKNYRHLRKWAKRTFTDAFRIYDREIPHFPLAIDFYAGRFLVHYYSKARTQDETPKELVEETTKALNLLFGSPLIYWKTRAKNKKSRQYEKLGRSNEFFIVHEFGIKFNVNLSDYLDTGLFLDHRETRKLVASATDGKKVLNLFAYTCAFSIHAALGGALLTKSVDMSNTYTEWGKDNFILNDLSLKNNQVVRADCLKFLTDEIFCGQKYDLIIIDPPTISRSKKMDQLFEIQVDYIPLIEKALKLLEKGGEIFFSTNLRKFSFDKTLWPHCLIQDITHKTLPHDFRDAKIHQCWKIILP
jgi:23S rRNA (cytosine1962-C5)-methyltransferase